MTRQMAAFKYRAYPTAAQERTLLSQLAEAARLYNAALQERRDAWRMCGKRIGFYDQVLQLKDIRAAGDIGIPSSKIAEDVLRRVDLAFKAFFRRVKAGERPGYPRFRSASRYDSLTTCRANQQWVRGQRVGLYGIGDIKIKLHRPLEGTVKTVSVKRAAGRWYVIFACEVGPQPLPPSSATVGIDVGLTSFAVLSNGETIQNPRHGKHGQRRLRVAQRRLARRVRGSRGRRKAVLLVQRAHERVANQRRDFHHKAARALVNRFGLIAVEDLNVKGLARSYLARPVHDAGWGQFLRLLTEKAESAARVLVAVNPAGTSQQCSGCGAIVPKRLSDRLHECLACGLSLGRDHNAALNILRAGMARAAPTWPDVGASVAAEADSSIRVPPRCRASSREVL